jgi:hypothetical protein
MSYRKTTSLIGMLGIVLVAAHQTKSAPQSYEDTFIHTHVSVPFNVQWADEFVRQVKAVKPDVVEVHATQVLDPDETDVRKKLFHVLYAKKLSEELGFNLSLTINLAATWYAKDYDNDERFVYRINPDGSRAGRWGRKHLCFNSPGVDEVIIPSYYRIAKEVKPWQVWVDESVIGVNLCYCQYCKALFKQSTGMDPPVKAEEDDEYWDQWVTFHRQTYERWMVKVNDAVKRASPETIVTINHAYYLEQPQATPDHIVNLSGDVHSEPLATGMYARYGATADVPYDLMPGLGSDIWAGIEPKPLAQIKEDIAVIIANGGRWNIGEFPTNRKVRADAKDQTAERPVDEYLQLALEGAAYARARQKWTHKTQPVTYGGILLGATTHYSQVIPRYAYNKKAYKDFVLTSDGKAIANKPSQSSESKTRIYWPGNRYMVQDVVGAYEALLENQIQFHIINEDTLKRDWEAYRFLVISGQFRLAADTIEAVEQFVKNGGTVIVEGTTLESGLLEKMGLPGAVKHQEPASLSHDGERFKFDQYYELSQNQGEVLRMFDSPSEGPAVVRYIVGDGQVVCIAMEFFYLYETLSPYDHSSEGGVRGDAARDYVDEIMETVLPNRPIRVEAPDYYEVTVNTKDGSTLVNLVDRSLNWKGVKQEAGEIDIAIRMPAKPSNVWLQPQGEPLEWRWEDGLVKTSVPQDKIDVFSIVEIQ